MESELMEAGGTIDEASSHCWSGICLWGNGPQERPVNLPHAVQRSESNMDVCDGHLKAHEHMHTHVHTKQSMGSLLIDNDLLTRS